MTFHKINNIFLDEELDIINAVINNTKIPKEFDNETGTGEFKGLGRLQIGNISAGLTDTMFVKINDLARSVSKENLSLAHAAYAEYSNKYGSPGLPPHFDCDNKDLIINFQLDSNTSWDLGVGFDLISLENNSAAIFNANTNIHWRPFKKFNDGEYVKMIFFRFVNLENMSDYSYLSNNPDNEAFAEVKKFRESLT